MNTNKEISDKIGFISYIIPEFADAYKMSIPNAYNYLKEYGGLQYLYNENIVWAVREHIRSLLE